MKSIHFAALAAHGKSMSPADDEARERPHQGSPPV